MSIINDFISLNQAYDVIIQIHLFEVMLTLLTNFYFSLAQRAFYFR